ncbi:hypothetical protein TorRG33x02_088930 [Trema orientale]|uniref:Uncharacterized protein n=1 Tax=Trema orientale TaxID=63057 RepID=A0A2P5FC38_TREOI|nr:hypothetical protein TorRG33x02_088930 [Trema orientale]
MICFSNCEVYKTPSTSLSRKAMLQSSLCLLAYKLQQVSQRDQRIALEFKLGDANNSCVKYFLVAAQAGSTAQNFTLLSNGTGSAKNFSLKFKADSSVTPISFTSYTTSLTKDGVSCGPVVDDVLLRVSRGMKPDMQWIFLVFLYLAAIPW